MPTRRARLTPTRPFERGHGTQRRELNESIRFCKHLIDSSLRHGRACAIIDTGYRDTLEKQPFIGFTIRHLQRALLQNPAFPQLGDTGSTPPAPKLRRL